MAAEQEPSWAPGPSSPLLHEGAAHLWRADLDAIETCYTELLSGDERERARLLLGARERRRWARGRAVLRALLGRYLSVDPAELRFRVDGEGKPALDPPTISFNLSHSGGLALYAVVGEGAVGVDVELARASHDVLAIAARILGAQETSRLRALEPAQREREFLRSWTRHEAEIKLYGLGIGGQLPGDRGSQWVKDIDIGSTGAAALAAAEPPRELRCWTWPPGGVL